MPFAFRVMASGFALVAELIVAERECCPVLDIRIGSPNLIWEPVIVRVTGPAGGKEFVKTILCNPR